MDAAAAAAASDDVNDAVRFVFFYFVLNAQQDDKLMWQPFSLFCEILNWIIINCLPFINVTPWKTWQCVASCICCEIMSNFDLKHSEVVRPFFFDTQHGKCDWSRCGIHWPRWKTQTTSCLQQGADSETHLALNRKISTLCNLGRHFSHMHSFSKDTREKCLNYKLAHLLIAVF